jgi:hypothetical protein
LKRVEGEALITDSYMELCEQLLRASVKLVVELSSCLST